MNTFLLCVRQMLAEQLGVVDQLGIYIGDDSSQTLGFLEDASKQVDEGLDLIDQALDDMAKLMSYDD